MYLGRSNIVSIGMTKSLVKEDIVVEQPSRERRRYEEDGKAVSNSIRSGAGRDMEDEVFRTLSLSA